MYLSPVRRGCAQTWKRIKHLGDPLKLCKEAPREPHTSLLLVETQGLGKVICGKPVDGPTH